MILKLKGGIFIHIESNIKPIARYLIHHFNVVKHMVYRYLSSLWIWISESHIIQAIFMHNNLWNVWWLLCTVYAFTCNLLCSVMFISQVEITYSRVSHSQITLYLVILHLVMMSYKLLYIMKWHLVTLYYVKLQHKFFGIHQKQYHIIFHPNTLLSLTLLC